MKSLSIHIYVHPIRKPRKNKKEQEIKKHEEEIKELDNKIKQTILKMYKFGGDSFIENYLKLQPEDTERFSQVLGKVFN